MRMFKKTLISLSMLILYANNAYATTTGTYVPSGNSGMGKFLLLILAVALVALVLFLGYKLDKNEASQKRKEKIIKKRNEDINDMYSDIYKSHKDEEEKVEEKVVVKKEYKKVEEPVEVIEEYDDITDDGLEEVEEYDEEDEENDFGSTQVIQTVKEEIKPSDSTMVFDTTQVKELENMIDKFSDVKDYEYEETDDELLELEQTIADANVKKYTRKKQLKKKPTKKYTRN